MNHVGNHRNYSEAILEKVFIEKAASAALRSKAWMFETANFMNEFGLLSPPPECCDFLLRELLVVNEKAKSSVGERHKQNANLSQSPNRRQQTVISSRENFERFRLLRAIDYATFFCLAYVNEPSCK